MRQNLTSTNQSGELQTMPWLPRMRRFLILISLCFSLLVSPYAHGQELQSIAVVVNDDVISEYDLYARLKLILMSLKLEDSSETRKGLLPQVRRSLIDESLKLQEAKKEKVSISKSQIDDAMRFLEKKNGIEEGKLGEHMELNGVDIATLESQLRASLSWNKLADKRLLPFVDVGEEEIQEVIERMEQNKGKPEYLVAEIFLQVDTPDEEKRVKATAEKLMDYIEKGRAFQQLARQFSHSASAATGGDIGWILPGDLVEELEKALASMVKNQVTGPIRSPAGFHILLLRGKRVSGSKGDASIELRQIFQSLPPGVTENEIEIVTKRIAKLSEGLSGCKAMAALTDDSGAALSNDLGMMKISDLPDNVQKVVRKIKIGKPSDPVIAGGGVMVFMACSRTQPQSTIPGRDQISRQIEFKRLDLLSQRYLRDLRRAAHIDIRIK